MKRQHPYDEKCRCQRCQAVKRLAQTYGGENGKATLRNLIRFLNRMSGRHE